MVLEAERRGCLREVLVIAAALSLQDPRERPAETAGQADQQHARFEDESSDFLDLAEPVALRRASSSDELSSSAFRRMCKRGVPQLPADPRVAGLRGPAAAGSARAARASNARASPAAEPDDATASTRRCSPGLLSHIGLQAEQRRAEQAAPSREYLGARGTRFVDLPRAAALAGRSRSSLMCRRAGRDQPAVGPAERRDQARSGPSGSARTWSSAPTPSRTGRRSAAR